MWVMTVVCQGQGQRPCDIIKAQNLRGRCSYWMVGLTQNMWLLHHRLCLYISNSHNWLTVGSFNSLGSLKDISLCEGKSLFLYPLSRHIQSYQQCLLQPPWSHSQKKKGVAGEFSDALRWFKKQEMWNKSQVVQQLWQPVTQKKTFRGEYCISECESQGHLTAFLHIKWFGAYF